MSLLRIHDRSPLFRGRHQLILVPKADIGRKNIIPRPLFGSLDTQEPLWSGLRHGPLEVWRQCKLFRLRQRPETLNKIRLLIEGNGDLRFLSEQPDPGKCPADVAASQIVVKQDDSLEQDQHRIVQRDFNLSAVQSAGNDPLAFLQIRLDMRSKPPRLSLVPGNDLRFLHRQAVVQTPTEPSGRGQLWQQKVVQRRIDLDAGRRGGPIITRVVGVGRVAALERAVLANLLESLDDPAVARLAERTTRIVRHDIGLDLTELAALQGFLLIQIDHQFAGAVGLAHVDHVPASTLIPHRNRRAVGRTVGSFVDERPGLVECPLPIFRSPATPMFAPPIK